MKIAAAARHHAEVITPTTTPPLDSHATTVEHVAGIDRGRGRLGSQANWSRANWAEQWLHAGQSPRQRFVPLVAAVAAAVALAAPVHADADTDFANQLHVYGVYGPRDYNAWLGKISCNRLGNGIDADAYESTAFLSRNLPRGTTTTQTWQYLNAAITTYCPNQMLVLTSVAGPRQ
jgi:hypothetical protein